MNNLKVKIFIGVMALSVIVLAVFAGKLVEVNDTGIVQVKQSVTGSMTVVTDPGPFLQLFGKLTRFNVATTGHFSKDEADGGEADTSVFVRFNGAGKGKVSGTYTYLMPLDKDNILRLKKEKTNQIAITYMVNQHLYESIKTAATIVKAGEVYAERKTEFMQVAEQMFREGIFLTKAETKEVPDPANPKKMLTEKVVNLVKDKNGKPEIFKDSPLHRYGITIAQFNIKDIDFDTETETMLSEEKRVEQQRKLSIKKADTAKQETLTKIEEAKKNLAIKQGEANIEKMQEVVKAEKEKEVAELKAEKELAVSKLAKESRIQKGLEQLEMAKLDKQAKQQEAVGIKALADANSYARSLMKKAGITPLQQAEIDRDKAIGMMREAAKAVGPKVVFIGGGEGGGQVDSLLKTYGAKAAMDLVNGLDFKEGK